MTSTATAAGGLQLLKRYAILGYGAVGTMLDVGLMVLGSLLVGFAVSVLLAGFEIVNVIPEEMSSGAMLASALVLGVVGLFCLGVASEGPLGRGRRLVGFKLWEVGVGRILAVLGVGFAAFFAYDVLLGLIDDLPVPFRLRNGGPASGRGDGDGGHASHRGPSIAAFSLGALSLFVDANFGHPQLVRCVGDRRDGGIDLVF